MYIHSIYKLINSIKEIKEYRKELKEISKINLRRSSKFNILAVLGALKATKEISFSNNVGIYVASEYGPIADVYNVMETVSEDEHIVMPFDFLNINSNNVSFYVSQALQANGKNTLLTSRYLSFEKALLLAMFDLEINEVDDVIIGGVDESLSCVPNYNKYLNFTHNKESKDGSCWFYANNEKTDALARITNVLETNNYEDLEKLLNKDYSKISLNQFANQDETIYSKIDKQSLLIEDDFYGTEGMINLLSLLEYKGNHLYISKDDTNNFVVVELTV